MGKNMIHVQQVKELITYSSYVINSCLFLRLLFCNGSISRILLCVETKISGAIPGSDIALLSWF